VFEKLRRHNRADRVTATVLGTGVTTTVTVEAGERVAAARFELAAENVSITHEGSIAERDSPGSNSPTR
jgi:hypothetical protein